MTTITEHIVAGAYWRERVLTAGEFIDSCYRFISELAKVSSSFSNRCTVADHEILVLPHDLPSFREILSKSLADPDYVYKNPDPSVDSFTLNSTLPQGFVAAFSECDPQATQESAVTILVRAGAHGHLNATGSAFLTLPPHQAGLAYDTVKRDELMEVMLRVWSPEYASISSKELIRVLDPERTNGRSFGALMYFEDQIVETVVADTPHVRVLPRPAAGKAIAIDAPAPWVNSVEKFRPCFEKLKNAGQLLSRR
jgi:hypothetical protein